MSTRNGVVYSWGCCILSSLMLWCWKRRCSLYEEHREHLTLAWTGGRYKFPNTHYRRLRRLIYHSLEHTLDYIPVPYYDLLTNPCWEKWVQTSPWNSMDFHLPTHGISWNSIFWRFVKFHGIPRPYCWNSMELQLLMIREIPWNSRQGKLKIHGTPAFHDLWNSMEFQTRRAGNPWNSRFYQFVEIHGFSHGLSGIPWIFSSTMWNSMEFQSAFFSLVARRRTYRILC